ncbi:hypothetical protein DFH11DRAFT_365152 [Phellopilus nigrolimitatus]|nr:hypothetical protein DFH11DRAFT_365152 [Phellopilus nigrolimitatus]
MRILLAQSLIKSVAILVSALAGVPRVHAATQNLTDAQIAIVVQRLAEGATHSWELGTREQALTELNTPAFSVLNGSNVPPPTSAPASLAPVFDIVAAVIANRTHIAGLSAGTPQPLVAGDGSAADPASNGVAALLANWTGQNNASVNFGQAAVDQMNYLWADVPRTTDGALSHRVAEVQLWSDFVYMVPPFLAYYGATTANQSMLAAAYTQVKLYRGYLRDSGAGGLWKHVVLGSDFQDPGHWSTGNGWAAAGMLRVLGTLAGSQYANAMKSERKDLAKWVGEIHDAMYAHVRSDGLFNNYADNASSFADASSTALLAATVYRTALLTQTYKHLPAAEAARAALWAPSAGVGAAFANASSLAAMTHFSANGWLAPVVNPNAFGSQGSESPEAQAFVLLMYAAWRDWAAAGAPGANAARGKAGGGPPSAWMLVALAMLVGAAAGAPL